MKHTKFRFIGKYHWKCDKCNYQIGSGSKKGLDELIDDHKKKHKRRPLGCPKK